MESDTINSVEFEEESNEAVNDSDQNVERNIESTSDLSQTSTSSMISRKRKATKEDRRLDKAFEILETSSQAIQDDCQHFGNLIAVKLRKFDENVRTYLESDIMRLFINANKGFYNFSSTCNYQKQMLSTHQTRHSAAETSHLSSPCSPLTFLESPSISSLATSSEDNIHINIE